MFDRIVHFLSKRVNFQYREVDFSEPWWKTFGRFRWLIGLVMVFELIGGGIGTALPLLVVEALQSSNNNLFYLLIAILLIQPVMFFLKAIIIGWVEAQEISSVFISANKHILQSDPINHQTRESGALISKIDKGSRSIEGIYDVLLFSVLITLVNIGTALFLFARADWILALLSTALLSISAYLVYIVNNSQKRYFQTSIDKDDDYESVSTESIQQSPHIRSLFNTPAQLSHIRRKLVKYQTADTDLWRKVDDDYNNISGFLYLGMVLFCGYCIYLIQNQTLTNFEALALTAIYVGLIDTVIRVSEILRTWNRETTRIKDLHNTINSFGETTFPTL